MTEKVEHTELPWVAHTKTGSPPFITRVSDNSGWICQTVTWCGVDEAIVNAEYIVLACNSYPALLAERDRLREALKEIRDIKPERIADTEFATGPLAHFQAAQRIARAAIKDTNQ